MGHKTGRPNIYQTDDIKLIIDQYVRYTEGKSLISASKVAKFAVDELHLSDNFKYYVIQRNPETKQYLEEINERIKNFAIANRDAPVAVFKTLDIEAMMNMSPNKLRVGLQNLNTMIEDTSDKYAKVIQENIKLSRLCVSLKTEIGEYKKELDEFIKKANKREDELTGIIEKQKEEVIELKSIMHIAWDKEAETILKKEKIFVDDGTEIDRKKTITDPTFNLIKTVEKFEVEKKAHECNTTEMRQGFLKGLEDI